MGKRIGKVVDEKLKAERMNTEAYNKFGSLMRVVDYVNCNDVAVYFPEYDWVHYHIKYKHFLEGKVKCPYEPRHFGVGYIGEGVFLSKNDDGSTTTAYRKWRDMLSRCYHFDRCLKTLSYENCYVCDEWLNFQNFAEWFYQNYYEIDGEIICLDKDILYKGNQLYSPENCVFAPQTINSLFIRTNRKGDLPIGVTFDKRRGTYQAKCHKCHNESEYLGTFKTVEEAFNAYKNFKEMIIKQTADLYKDYIPNILYEALYNYEVEITD